MQTNRRLVTPGSMLFTPLLIALTCLTIANCAGPSGQYGAQLEAGFRNPPDSAKPRVWWHWMNGNITKEGIRADFAWMNRIGIGGFHNFDAALTTPQIVEKRLVYMTPEWKDAFRFTTRLADSLGFEMAIAGSPGWSESGGPWVKPEQAMKKIVWSETRIEGGRPFTGALPKPPSATGRYQNMSLDEEEGVESNPRPEFYQDIAVIAFRVPENDITMMELHPAVTSSGGDFDLAMLTDGDVNTTSLLPAAPAGERAWIQYEFRNPETIQSLTLVGSAYSGIYGGSGNLNDKILEASDDGVTFRKITGIPSNRVGEVTLTFAPVTAKYFRFSFRTGRGGRGRGSAGTQIAELVLHRAARINRFEEKAAFAATTELPLYPTPAVTAADVVAKTDIVDLTSRMNTDGTVDWTPGDGAWAVLRMGYSLTGHRNAPASPEATGLEVDKLSAAHVRDYFTTYLDMYEDATGGLMGKRGLQYVITDSWEAGTQNWTDTMAGDFKARRGYDLLPWLPVVAGYIVDSANTSERFLWDFRKTIADLTTENHYDQLTDILNERGMGRYTESHEDQRALIDDGMDVKRGAAVPMSATWTPTGNQTEVQTRFKADVRESASVAHIYGQNLAAAESMTAIRTAWRWSPETLKPTADMEMASGLNRFVIHTSVHQPVDDKIPGLGLGPYGQWFTRHETWAEQAAPWISYLTRSSYMLQQGRFVADVCYFYGEDSNITALFGSNLPDVPEGYEYDFVNADALMRLLSVQNQSIVTPSGMSYRVLALDRNCSQMSLPVLRKIRDLVQSGAIVIGSKPLLTPSLSDDQAEFQSIVDELWAVENGENPVGAGTVYAGQSIQEVMNTLKIAPDFTYRKPQGDTNLLYVHRQLGDVDFYWVNNRNDRVEDLEATFRVDGRAAEIWHPDTGVIENASYTIANGATDVSLHLEPNDAVFVVFRNKADGNSFTVPKRTWSQLAAVEGPWDVRFQEGRGAPAQIVLDSLTPWNENADDGVKYFSGTGTYEKTIQAPAGWFENGSEVWIDLGDVKNLAEVIVNGVSQGIVWKTPFRIDLTNALKEGENTLEIKVTNLWVNRLIGDQQPGAQDKITYTTQAFYQADSPLLPSGLLGPVQILRSTQE